MGRVVLTFEVKHSLEKQEYEQALTEAKAAAAAAFLQAYGADGRYVAEAKSAD